MPRKLSLEDMCDIFSILLDRPVITSCECIHVDDDATSTSSVQPTQEHRLGGYRISEPGVVDAPGTLKVSSIEMLEPHKK